jgi:CRP-like cAMP-binding protein
LLGALPAADYERLGPALHLEPLVMGRALYSAGEQQRFAHFPTSGMVSQRLVLEDGRAADTALIGREGLVGMAICTLGTTMPNEAVVEQAGHAYLLEAQTLRKEFFRGGALQQLVLRYMHALITQTGQAVICNRFHSVEQRLCRWLLSTLDHVPSNEFTVTHESLARILGSRRESVTEAAKNLRSAGLMDHQRGRITVLDRAGLEERVCECYAVINKEYNRLLPANRGEPEAVDRSQARHSAPEGRPLRMAHSWVR